MEALGNCPVCPPLNPALDTSQTRAEEQRSKRRTLRRKKKNPVDFC